MAEKLRLKLLNIAVIDKITVSSKAPDTQNEVPFRLGTCIEKKDNFGVWWKAIRDFWNI